MDGCFPGDSFRWHSHSPVGRMKVNMSSGQIITTSQEFLGPQKVAVWKGNGTLYFKEV